MPIHRKIPALILTFLCALSVNVYSADNLASAYNIQQSADDPDVLLVNLKKPATNQATKLVLYGLAMGVRRQIDYVTCDGNSLKEESPGQWLVPADCQNLGWRITLERAGKMLANAQQSLRDGGFLLLSEASSLPRLEENTENNVKLNLPDLKATFPLSSNDGSVYLPKSKSAPQFELINPVEVESKSNHGIKLTYLIDNQNQIARLPKIDDHLKGLVWMQQLFATANAEFVVGWLGVSGKIPGLGGATGEDILLVNYSSDGDVAVRNTLSLYVAMHEAFHQMSKKSRGLQPWLAESLASYYGMRALRFAQPEDKSFSNLEGKFLDGADAFKDGLIEVNKKVRHGDRSEYFAFYTKGYAFWRAVDEELKNHHQDKLDNHILGILSLYHDKDGMPIGLKNTLKLSDAEWERLKSTYL